VNRQRLFVASCIALVATAMSFAIRGDIMGEVQRLLALNDVQVGWILGAAFWGFGLSILIGGPLCDVLGMGTILRLAAAGHIGGALLTVFSTSFEMFFASTVVVGVANGLVEAAINPLVATIYAEDKTRRLVTLHAWFPGGIVIGGVLAFIFTQVGLNWQAKTLILLVPSVTYAAMVIGQRFPQTERKAAGVPASDMVKEITRPLFLVIWGSMWITAATELGPGSWIPTIFNRVMGSSAQAGILVVVWINGLMYLLRQFGANAAHAVSPIALIGVTAIPAAVGLYLFSLANSTPTAFAAAALFAAGIAFWWPTMLGITSERFPRGGALLLAIIGASGSFSTAIAGPIMGWISETYGTERVLAIWALLPCLLIVIFGGIYLYDRSRGGYAVEKLPGQAASARTAAPRRTH
jgi:MFS family permease